MLRFLKKSKSRSGRIVGVAFGDEGAAAVELHPPRRDTAAEIGASTYISAVKLLSTDRLGDWVADARLGNAPTVGVLAPGEYQVVQIDAPEVPAGEMRQAATWRVREMIDYPIDQAVIDTYDPPASGQRGARKVNVVVARRHAVAERIETLREAGLEPVAIDIPELVQRNICARLPSSRRGHALLALEHGSGLLTLFRDGEQFLARSLDTGLAGLQRDDDGAVHALVLEVQRSLDYFESALQQSPIGLLYVYPGDERAAALVDALQGNLEQLDCEPVSLADLVSFDDAPEHVGATTLHALGAGLREVAA